MSSAKPPRHPVTRPPSDNTLKSQQLGATETSTKTTTSHSDAIKTPDPIPGLKKLAELAGFGSSKLYAVSLAGRVSTLARELGISDEDEVGAVHSAAIDIGSFLYGARHNRLDLTPDELFGVLARAMIKVATDLEVSIKLRDSMQKLLEDEHE